MEDNTTRTETCEITDENVVVERIAEYGDRGVIVTLSAESRDSEPATLALTDEFPDDLPVADVAFRPEAEPDGSRISPDGVSIECTVEPDEERTVVYALRFSEPAPDADLGEPELIADGLPPEEPREGTSIVDHGGPTTTEPAVPSQIDVGSASADREDDEGIIGATLGLFSGDRRSSHRSRATDGGVSTPSSTDSSGPDEPTDSEAVPVNADPPSGGTDGRPDTSSGRSASTTDASGPADADDGVVSALVTELREGSVDDGELAALRRELGVGHATADDVRIDHLESRVSEFAAYADALRAVIDEHGTAEEFVGRFEHRIDGLRTDLAAVDSELSAIRERLDSLEERTEVEFESIREEVNARHEETAGAAEAAEAIEAVERLETRVEDVESLRKEFASVFDGLGGGPA